VSGFHIDDVVFIKSSGVQGGSEHHKVKVLIIGEAGLVLKLAEKLQHTCDADSTEVERLKKTAG